ncbi:MAG: DUF2254 domain-containing protein [Boseongicola sp.]|nr:DUF2254 domain-containing protein [Boseongicola sp.]
MISQYFFRAREVGRRLWVRAALISGLALVAPVLAPLLSSFLPDAFLTGIGIDQVRTLLDILANSMLAVTTFSLTVMVTAHLAADQSASPRGHRLLREDGGTQTVLATFVGSFVFALVSIVVLQTRFVSAEATGAYYLMTLVVFGIVIFNILRWIGQLASLGSVEATIATAEEQARSTLRTRAETPFLGARHLRPGAEHDSSHSLLCPSGGYVRHIDTGKLSSLLEDRQGKALLEVLPGSFVNTGDPLAHLSVVDLTDEDAGAMCRCFVVGRTRSFDQDPIFAVSVLTEIAERALSPGINDPRTAMDVCDRLNLILDAFEDEVEPEECAASLVFAPSLDLFSLVQSAFEPIARDGKSNVQVQAHVQSALKRLSEHRSSEIAEAARIVSGRALAYSDDGLLLAADRARIKAIAPVKSAASKPDG